MEKIYSKNIVSHQGVIEGYITVEDGKILSLDKGVPTGDYIDFKDASIFPGFIDVHVHGWGRGSYMFENTPQSIIRMGEDQAREGVTGFLATTVADSIEKTLEYIETGNQVYGQRINGAALLGIHLEGPFINKEHKGMQKEEYCIKPDLSIMKEFYNHQKDKSMIKLMTMAPELDDGMQVLKFCKEFGIQVSAGHTAVGLSDLSIMKDYGVGGVTHMFSGMQGFHHRDLGTAGAALYLDDIVCEFAKQTGMTVKHEAFDMAFKIKGADKIMMTTDCAGMSRLKTAKYHYTRKLEFIPEGNNMRLKHDDGREEVVSLEDYEFVRTIEMSYLESIKNMLKHTPMSKIDVAKITSKNPAKYIHLQDKKGMIIAGHDADFTIVDKDYDLLATVVNGEFVYKK